MRFEKVSFEEYVKSIDGYEKMSLDDKEDVWNEYQNIKLPKRATAGSAGYDFFAPIPFALATSCNTGYPSSIKIATGIRVLLDNDNVLKCYPRSGHGFKYRLQLDNTVGIIDSDYSQSDNEGHIFAKLTIDAREDKILIVNRGEAFMQGVVEKFYTVDDDESADIRNGGFGSTSINYAGQNISVASSKENIPVKIVWENDPSPDVCETIQKNIGKNLFETAKYIKGQIKQ